MGRGASLEYPAWGIRLDSLRFGGSKDRLPILVGCVWIGECQQTSIGGPVVLYHCIERTTDTVQLGNN